MTQEYHVYPRARSSLASWMAWRRHQMETFSPLLALCEGNPLVTGGFPSQRSVTRSFEVLFYLRLNCWANNRDAGDLRRRRAHYNVTVMGNLMLPAGGEPLVKSLLPSCHWNDSWQYFDEMSVVLFWMVFQLSKMSSAYRRLVCCGVIEWVLAASSTLMSLEWCQDDKRNKKLNIDRVIFCLNH